MFIHQSYPVCRMLLRISFWRPLYPYNYKLRIPKGRFFRYVSNVHWYIGACVETCRRHVPTLWCDLCPRLLWWAWIIAYYQSSHGLHRFYRAFFVGEKSHGWTNPSKPSLWEGLSTTQQTQQEDSTKVGMREFDFVRVLICGNLWQKNPSRIYSNIDSIFFGVMTL